MKARGASIGPALIDVGEKIPRPFISPFFHGSNEVGHISSWHWPPNHHGLNQMVDYVRLKTAVPEALGSLHRERRERNKIEEWKWLWPSGGPMLMNRWCGRGKVKPVRVGVSGTPCCVDRCADVRFSSPACSAKAVACVQNALIYPSLFFVIFGPAHGRPNCLSRRKIPFFCSLSHLFFSGRIAEQCFRILRDTWLAVTMV